MTTLTMAERLAASPKYSAYQAEINGSVEPPVTTLKEEPKMDLTAQAPAAQNHTAQAPVAQAPIAPAEPATPAVPVEPVADDEVTELDDLPHGAGSVDYREGRTPLPTVVTDADLEVMSNSLPEGAGLIKTSHPITFIEPSIDKKTGERRVSKTGKLLNKRIVTKMPYITLYGADDANWIAENGAGLVHGYMLHQMLMQMQKQDVRPEANTLFNVEFICHHYGADNLAEAVLAELQPWEAVKVTSSAAASELVCGITAGGIPLQELFHEVFTDYGRYTDQMYAAQMKGQKQPHSTRNALTAPLSKMHKRYASHADKAAKAVAEGKAEPKLAIKSLPGETIQSMQDMQSRLETYVGKRRTAYQAVKAGHRKPGWTDDDVANTLRQLDTAVSYAERAICLFGVLITNMRAAEARRAKKYAEDASAAAVVASASVALDFI